MANFSIELSVRVTLSPDQVWPDGDGPSEPTAADVIAAMKETDEYSPIRVFEEWNLADRAAVFVMNLDDRSRKDKAWW
jgi:hypothetical protein